MNLRTCLILGPWVAACLVESCVRATALVVASHVPVYELSCDGQRDFGHVRVGLAVRGGCDTNMEAGIDLTCRGRLRSLLGPFATRREMCAPDADWVEDPWGSALTDVLPAFVR